MALSFGLQEKCHHYWPSERSARYQYFVVDPMTEYNMPQYILREFKVTDARVSISIYHSVVSVLHNMSNCFERFLSVSQATSLLLQLSDN